MWKTREIQIGKVGVGGNNPIRIQSMTTSDTRDVQSTGDQIMRLADAGCEIVRVTVQGKKEAAACESIKNLLLQKGYEIPLVADIHFYPPAAMLVSEFVDKVRINPGNFVDRRATFKTLTYDNETYQKEIERIEEKFTPLVEKCKKLKRAMRIGCNHGSLSDRIMNRYGDTPFGMVESALEFARICRKCDFHNFLFSMKASNPLVMIEAYRLLISEMMKLNWDYPLHLGVTEAGDGEDGRVKSAVGIGSLLLDGVGDTIRVSLTEDPWFEIDPCKRLIALASDSKKQLYLPKEIKRRPVSISPPLHRDGSVILTLSEKEQRESNLLEKLGFKMQFGKAVKTPLSVDAVIVSSRDDHLQKSGITVLSQEAFTVRSSADWETVLLKKPTMIFLALSENKIHEGRSFFKFLHEHQLKIPVILRPSYNDCSSEDVVIHSAAECGALLADGYGDGICLETFLDIEKRRLLSFNILQVARMRSSKTEFIACPSCGRTLFNLQAVTKRIREKTEHLPGVKIAIMGCIVNGPGEMADADFGYVGSRKGKVDLYVGKTCVTRNIDDSVADERLIDLIKAHGRWIDREIETQTVEV